MANKPPEGTAQYLSTHLGAPVQIVSCKQSFPGASRETWLIQAEVGGALAGFALRIDAPKGQAIPFSLKREYGVYEALHGSAVPVAEPLWYGEGVSFAEGRPHMVRRLVDGSNAVPGLDPGTEDGRRRSEAAAKEVLERLATVHLLDWRALGLGEILGAPASAADALRFDFENWVGFWNERKPDADPLIEEVICCLRESVPRDTTRISLLKGNSGVGEEIWKDGKIVAMSDWELAALGDPAADLAFSTGTFQLGDFEELLAHYEKCLGEQISPQRMAFGAFLVWFKTYVCNHCYMLRSFIDRNDPRLTNLTFGEMYAHRVKRWLATCLSRDLVSAWQDVRTHDEPIYATFQGKQR